MGRCRVGRSWMRITITKFRADEGETWVSDVC